MQHWWIWAEYLHPSPRPSHFSDTLSSRLGTGSGNTWCQRQCCRRRSTAFSGFLQCLSTSRTIAYTSGTLAIVFITDGIAPAGDPLLAVISPSPRWGLGRAFRGIHLWSRVFICQINKICTVSIQENKLCIVSSKQAVHGNRKIITLCIATALN